MSEGVRARREEQAARLEAARLAEATRLEEAARLAEAARLEKEAALSSSSSSSAQGGPKTTKKAASKRLKKTMEEAMDDEEQDEKENKGEKVNPGEKGNLDIWKQELTHAGKSPQMINLLVFDNTDDFNTKWPKDIAFDELKWEAVLEIFVLSSYWVRKDQNVYLNEIRERALLFIIDLEDSQFSSYSEPVKSFLKELRDLWIARICDCRDTFILENYPEGHPELEEGYLAQFNAIQFNTLERIGGRANSDFKFFNPENTEQEFPMELKFSRTKKSDISDLVQFIGLNLEGRKALEIFGASYLDFFHTRGYLERMVAMFNDPKLGMKAGTLKMPTDITQWKTAAAATSPPARSSTEIKEFFDTMRRFNKDPKTSPDFIRAKKDLVNASFRDFIDSRLDYLNTTGRKPLERLLDEQTKKYFCIFGEENGHVKCDIDLMPKFTVVSVDNDRKNHTCLINTGGTHNIRIGASNGNGGAGSNNPRVLLSLESSGMAGGGSSEIELPDYDPEILEEDAIFSPGTTILKDTPPITTVTEIREGMVLRSGKVLMQKWRKNEKGQWVREFKGGRRKSPNTIYSKTKNVKSKKNKKNKFTKKYRNKSRNKMSKNRK